MIRGSKKLGTGCGMLSGGELGAPAGGRRQPGLDQRPQSVVKGSDREYHRAYRTGGATSRRHVNPTVPNSQTVQARERGLRGGVRAASDDLQNCITAVRYFTVLPAGTRNPGSRAWVSRGLEDMPPLPKAARPALAQGAAVGSAPFAAAGVPHGIRATRLACRADSHAHRSEAYRLTSSAGIVHGPSQ